MFHEMNNCLVGFFFKIQRNGLLTFVDFSFLLNILSTPRRYMDIAFHAFDVSADGNCEAKVNERT